MTDKVKVYGKAQNRVALGIVHAFLQVYPEASLEDLRNAFPHSVCPDCGVKELLLPVGEAELFNTKMGLYFVKPEEILTLSDGSKIALAQVWSKTSLGHIINKAKTYNILAATPDKSRSYPTSGFDLEYHNGWQSTIAGDNADTEPSPIDVSTKNSNKSGLYNTTETTSSNTSKPSPAINNSPKVVAVKGLPREYVPSETELKSYLERWDILQDYVEHEKALHIIFREDPRFAANTDIRFVIIKCSALNDFYATNIYKIAPVARNIVAIKDFDARLTKGDDTLVDEIAYVDGRRNYSFATKYCSHHQPDRYPIYDRYVEDVLTVLRQRNPRAFRFKNRGELKVYSTFRSAIDDFRKAYGLEVYTYKDIDRYLWQLGKDYYNPYKRHTHIK